jgi:transposase InsO family protein
MGSTPDARKAAQWKTRGCEKYEQRIAIISFPSHPHLLEQDFTASAPNKKWMTDFTYIDTREGWLFRGREC